MRHRRPDQEERARHVDIQRRAPGVVGDVGAGAPEPHTGVGHYDVETTELLDRARDRCVGMRRIADVPGDRDTADGSRDRLE